MVRDGSRPVDWQVQMRPDGQLSIRFRVPGSIGVESKSAGASAYSWESYTLKAVSVTVGGTREVDGFEQKNGTDAGVRDGSPADMLCRRLLGHHALAIKNARTDNEASALAKDVDALRVRKEELAVQVETLQEDLEIQMQSYLTTLEDRAEAIEKANDVKYAAIEVQALRKKITSDGSPAASAFAATGVGRNKHGVDDDVNNTCATQNTTHC